MYYYIFSFNNNTNIFFFLYNFISFNKKLGFIVSQILLNILIIIQKLILKIKPIFFTYLNILPSTNSFQLF